MSKSNVRIPIMFSIAEIAERFEISEKTIQRRIATGELHAHRFGRIVRISEEDARTFAASSRG